MAFRFFLVPIAAPDEPTLELNAFLRSHRIIKVDRQWVAEGMLWSLCVEYLDGASGSGILGRSTGAKGKLDYKDILSPEDFAIFAKLRDARKALAQRDAVPVYTVFTNEQLAQMVTNKVNTRTGLAKIEGIGEARIEKYGNTLLDILVTAWPTETVTHETGRKPV